MRNSVETTDSPTRDELARHVPAMVLGVVLAVGVPVGITRGLPGVVLWLAFSVLAGAVLLFWEAARLVLDPTLPGDAMAEGSETGIPAELETRKRAALRALRDISYERAIGRLSEEDYKALEERYRAEARLVMRAIDDGVGPWMARAEAMLSRAESQDVHGEGTPSETASGGDSVRVCPGCATVNDPDAVFCKRCGAKVSDAS